MIAHIRKQVQTLARCEDHDLRKDIAEGIADDLCEVEHLLEIHRAHREDPPRS